MTRRYADKELLADDPGGQLGPIEAGTVGWGDGKDHFDAPPGEVTLVKVTLFRGRNPDRDPEPEKGRAGGLRILARISAPLNHIPPDKAEVLVSFPSGFEITPGVGVITGQPATTPENQFSGSRSKLDFGPDMDVVFKARSVTITDYENRFITVGPKYGLKIGHDDASGAHLEEGRWLFYVADGGDNPDGKAVFELSLDAVKLSHKAAADDKKVNLKFKGGDCTIACEGNFNAAYKTAWLGAKPLPVPLPLPVAAGPAPGTVSSNTFVSVG